MGTFSRFISDDEEDEYQRGLGEDDHRSKDWAWLVQAARDPSGAQVESAPTDPRQARRPDGLGTALAMKETQGQKSQMPTLAAGDFGGDMGTAKRIEIAQRMSDNPEQDPLPPGRLEEKSGGKMFSDANNAEPVKPPGPDSPSTGYKEPSRYDKAKAEYDKEFGPGKKHKWYSLESTDAWESRRAAGQHNLMLEQRQEEEERRQAQNSQAHGLGLQTFRSQDGKKQVYMIQSDGTPKLVMEGLDEAAKKTNPYLSDTITWDKTTGYGYKQRADTQKWERQDVPAPGAPPVTGFGPTGPDNMLPMTNPKPAVSAATSKYIIRSPQSDVVQIGPDGRPVVALHGTPRASTAAPKDTAAELDKLASAEAMRLLKSNEKFLSPGTNDETKRLMFADAVESAKKRILASRGGSAGPAASADDDVTELTY